VKRLVNRTLVLLVMCAITSVAAWAKTTTRVVTFTRDVTVNGTLVTAGTYKVIFDDQTGELTITSGKKTVAKTPARIEKIEGNSYGVYITRAENERAVLLSVTLKGGNRAVIDGSDGAERAQ
jgi:hypothetical protein